MVKSFETLTDFKKCSCVFGWLPIDHMKFFDLVGSRAFLWDLEHFWGSFVQPLSSECWDACVESEQKGCLACRQFLQIMQAVVLFLWIPFI